MYFSEKQILPNYYSTLAHGQRRSHTVGYGHTRSNIFAHGQTWSNIMQAQIFCSKTAVQGRTRPYTLVHTTHTVAQNRFLLHTVAQTTVHGHTRSHKKSRSAGMAYPEGDFLTVIFAFCRKLNSGYPMFHHCLLTRVSKV